ncbi:MAG: hypothetical protein ABI540_04535 [Spartobacteria bacterium]
MNLRPKLGMFLLTRQEQRTIAFIVLAVVLGLATKHYRDSRSRPAEPPNETAAVSAPVSPSPGGTPMPVR